MGRPLVAPTLALMAGIAVSSRLEAADTTLLIVLLFQLALLLPCRRRHWTGAGQALMLGTFFIVGWLHMNVYLYRPPTPDHIVNFLGREPVTITGLIDTAPAHYPEKTDLVVAVAKMTDPAGNELSCSGRVLLSFHGRGDLAYGDVVRARSRLRPVRNFNNPGGFDYARYLRFQGILVRGYLADDAGIVVLRRGFGNPLRQRLEAIRASIRTFIDRRAPFPEREIIKACILGDQQEIPREIRDAFSKTGASHIIAISGFNMGLIAFFTVFLVRSTVKWIPSLLLRFDMTKVAVLAAVPPVILYTFIAGAGMSVLRATLMILAFMAALLIARNRDLYNTLAMAALIVLMFYPPALFDISFQLSFAAVVAILYFTPRLTAFIPPPPKPSAYSSLLLRRGRMILYETALFLAVSLSAMLGTMPLIALYFNRISLVAFPANIILVPLLGILAVPLSLASVFFMPFSSSLSTVVLDLAGLLVMSSLAVNDFFAALPWSSLYLTTPGLPEIFSFYLLIYGIFRFFPPRPDPVKPEAARIVTPPLWVRYAVAATVLFFIGNGIFLYERDRNRAVLSAAAIDVGQGNSTLVRFPGEKVMLIDGGGFPNSSFDVGRYIVAPYLWHERISAVDIVVLTHPHPDHLHGLLFILENFTVREVWSNGDEVDTPEYRRFNAAIAGHGIPHRRLSARDDGVVVDGVRIKFLNPDVPGPGSAVNYAAANDRSLVMRMTYGGVSFLFPGDISGPAEANIVSRGEVIASSVLFVPHHGGRTSTTEIFLAAVQPAIAVVSVGFGNTFGLPHPDVLERLEKGKVRVYRTDCRGMITAVTDGADISVTAYLPGKPPQGRPDDGMTTSFFPP
ncbi:MAG TPA: DNA internalization-related competence protein ComEC/Rec2 [Syntrophales bacterium]|nr:DNA internalization-related competence protein ComEC/Rec2 [Syntrophales bacterium]HPC31434.1 DNA internalization-related competence protein ComEC/Rec2 [Syntrophales bacterium]HQG33340.1 DNA internalization-related competence protein ComEC/Rec2 [Syntrophales bacterium]HQJ29603.1 DNA internalization-related competence protein ComEC/Rec2 [Syntrophales bacterium]HRU87352.1 DNA internalization-related competence protein ComEC/Rec2 [Syntrophales bacterium]